MDSVYIVVSREDHEGGENIEVFSNENDANACAKLYADHWKLDFNQEYNEYRSGCMYVIVQKMVLNKKLEDSGFYKELKEEK